MLSLLFLSIFLSFSFHPLTLPPSIPGHSPEGQLSPLDKHPLNKAGGMPLLLPFSSLYLRHDPFAHLMSPALFSAFFLTVHSSSSLPANISRNFLFAVAAGLKNVKHLMRLAVS